MFKSKFEQLNEWSWIVAGLLSGSYKQRSEVYNGIIHMIAECCNSYEKDVDFKKEINNYIGGLGE